MSADSLTVLVGTDGEALVAATLDREPPLAGPRLAFWIGARTDPELAEFEAEIGPPNPMTQPAR